jgi:DNA adenine methylase
MFNSGFALYQLPMPKEVMTKKSKPFLHYPGGKGSVGVYQNIINCMPPHDLYIEAFLGGGSVLLHKKPALKSVGVDLDEKIVTAWRLRCNYPGLEVIHADAIDFLKSWSWSEADKTRTLVYCDPPYLRDVRRSGRKVYDHDLPDQASHIKLISTLKSLSCMVMLSGYSSPLYESLLCEWRQAGFQSKSRAGHLTREIVWMNYPEPSELHDYRYLGQGFRDRQRIKRQQERWRSKLLQMPELERNSLINVLNEALAPDTDAHFDSVT